MTSTGFPTAALSEVGSLPSGVTFSDNGDGTATLSGTPAAGTGGTYPITITATNGVSPDATQTFTLTVDEAPAITSGDSTTFTEGSAGTFTVTSTGFPTAALSEVGSLPSGVTFSDNGDGTATLSGTPAAGTGGSYPITITATNGVSPGRDAVLHSHRRRGPVHHLWRQHDLHGRLGRHLHGDLDGLPDGGSVGGRHRFRAG